MIYRQTFISHTHRIYCTALFSLVAQILSRVPLIFWLSGAPLSNILFYRTGHEPPSFIPTWNRRWQINDLLRSFITCHPQSCFLCRFFTFWINYVVRIMKALLPFHGFSLCVRTSTGILDFFVTRQSLHVSISRSFHCFNILIFTDTYILHNDRELHLFLPRTSPSSLSFMKSSRKISRCRFYHLDSLVNPSYCYWYSSITHI